MLTEQVAVLVVEDSPMDARFATRALHDAGPFSVHSVGTLAECLAWLEAEATDVVLLDLHLPDSAGMDTLAAVVGAHPSVPVVVVTGADDEAAASETMRRGAQDYVVKGKFTPELLARAIRYAIERKRFEQALLISERKWRNVLVNTPQIGVSLDSAGRIVFANAFFLELTGWTEAEIIGRDWFETCLPEDVRASVRGVFDRVMASRDTLDYSTYQNPIITRNGERRDISWANVLTRDGEGNIVDVTCLGVDLTDRQRAEDALRLSEERLQLVLRSTGVGWWDMDLTTGEIYLSPEWWRLLGYEYGELPPTAETWRSLTHPEDRDAAERAYHEALENGLATFEFESRRKHRDGHWVPILTRGYISRDAQGIAVRATGTAADITEQKRSREAIADALARFESVIQTAPTVAIQTYDRDGTIRQWNRASERIYGFSAEQAIGVRIDELLHEDPETGCQNTIRRVWDRGVPSEPAEFELKDASGQTRWVYSCMFPLFERGRVVLVCCMDVDITDRKLAEAEAARQLDELRRWQAVIVGREERIMELKREVNALCARIGLEAPYGEAAQGFRPQ